MHGLLLAIHTTPLRVEACANHGTVQTLSLTRQLSYVMVIGSIGIPLSCKLWTTYVTGDRTTEESDGTYTTILLAKHTHRIRFFAIPWYYYDKIRLRLERPDPETILLSCFKNNNAFAVEHQISDSVCNWH